MLSGAVTHMLKLPMDDKNFDEKAAKQWAELIESSEISERDSDIYPMVNEWLINTNAKSVLDLGCGQGICSSKLSLYGCDYSGVDPSPHLISRAKKLYPEFIDKFLEGNAYKLPFEASRFESVFSIAVWHLLEDIDLAINEMSRVLVDNGQFLIITADGAKINDWRGAYVNSQIDGDKLLGLDSEMNIVDTLYIRSVESIAESLKKSQLEITSVVQFRMWVMIKGKKI